jgi:hypothetical protein
MGHDTTRDGSAERNFYGAALLTWFHVTIAYPFNSGNELFGRGLDGK